MVCIYGIKNCDTVKNARRWLEQAGVAYTFHDVRADGLDPERLANWCAELGWEALLNRRGMTWRGLSESEKSGLDAEKAEALMLRYPAMIKRPVLEAAGHTEVGFSPARYEALFS